MANPFDGSALPPVYTPKTFVDPYTHIIWKLSEGGYGWEQSGIQAPAGTEPPMSIPMPAALQEYLRNASPVDTSARAIASANSVQRENANYNATLYDRYLSALAAEGTGKGLPAPDIRGKYRIADFPTLFNLISHGIDTTLFNPPEVNFNTRG